MLAYFSWRNVTFLIILGFLTSCATSKLNKADRKQTAGRTIVVTGASSGFGRGVALRLGEYGANVVLAARRTDVLEEVAAQIRAAGGKANAWVQAWLSIIR